MYGLVNQGLEDFVVQRFGGDTWRQVLQRAGVAQEMFISMDSYPDELSFKLVGAASELLGMDADALLEAFGQHWVLYTAQVGYGEMLAMAGSDLKTFLLNLDTLHSHVGMTFPDLRPPSFEVESLPASEQGLLLHYRSERQGMAPMVIGLIEGLGQRFRQPVTVRQIAFRGPQDHDVFRIEYIEVPAHPAA
ncbi:heme NO-binding domain-containing protein [Ideonella azotifigens]|uniref:Heme NO-binding domain-containing protein n=1 Tax=Ideonella azotifigens TaxID=513160 RepID=A0ABP3VME2_9BURK|nr:heme NO-binding domain-containing protein [Ideonella azotifigens]MCD2343069.1 heme NO-binding domain-containing protein [Ideonella azotifigens]